MSLEQVILDNTAAIRDLIQTIKAERAIKDLQSHNQGFPLINNAVQTIGGKAEIVNFKADLDQAIKDIDQSNEDYATANLATHLEEKVKEKKPVVEAPQKVTADALPVTQPKSEITPAEVGMALTNAAKISREKVVAVLADFGVKRGSELDASDYAAFIEAVSKIKGE